MAILYGIKKAVMTELDPATGGTKSGGKVVVFDTAEECSLEPVLSEGSEEIMRNSSKILAVVREDDLLYGYNIKLKDTQFNEDMVGLVAGYKVEANSGEDVVASSKKITTPIGGGRGEAKPFQLDLYVANYEGDSIKDYCKISFSKCEGKFPEMTLGKEFMAPEFEIKARENTKAKKPIKEITFVTKLPTTESSVMVAEVSARKSK